MTCLSWCQASSTNFSMTITNASQKFQTMTLLWSKEPGPNNNPGFYFMNMFGKWHRLMGAWSPLIILFDAAIYPRRPFKTSQRLLLLEARQFEIDNQKVEHWKVSAKLVGMQNRDTTTENIYTHLLWACWTNKFNHSLHPINERQFNSLA